MGVFFSSLFAVLGSHIATIISAGLIVGAAYVGLSPKGRQVIQGFRNYLTSTAANNPKIAAGIFDEKLDELRGMKKKAVEIAEKAHGAYVEACDKQQKAKSLLAEYSRKAKALESKGDHDGAILLARQAQSAKATSDSYTLKLPDLKAMAEAASKRVSEIDWKMEEVKQKKILTIENIKKGNLEKELSEALMELNVSNLDATIEGIEAHSNETKYIGIGTRMAYENSDAKRIKDASESADYGDAEDFLKLLMDE